MTDIQTTSEITVRLIQQMGGDRLIASAARVCTTALRAQGAGDGWGTADCAADAGLINYLMQHRHGTPFEHSAMTFYTHAPIFVWREWHRHRVGFSYNEESGRYKQLEPVFWVPRVDRRMIPAEAHTARPKFVPASLEDYRAACVALTDIYTWAYGAYELMLAAGIAKEVARACLPVGIYSSCWVTCNPRSLMAFLSLRTHEPDAEFLSYPQAEIEEAARAAEAILKEGWPLTHAAFVKYGRVAP